MSYTKETLHKFVKDVLNDSIHSINHSQALFNSELDPIDTMMFITDSISSGSISRSHAVKIKKILTEYIMIVGTNIHSEADMERLMCFFLEQEKRFYKGTISWFITAVVIRNKILPIETFMTLTAERDNLPSPLPELRSEFWNGVNGYTIREKYFKVWLDTESRDPTGGSSNMPEQYAYKIWFNLVIPEELKLLMPEDFSDPRLDISNHTTMAL